MNKPIRTLIVLLFVSLLLQGCSTQNLLSLAGMTGLVANEQLAKIDQLSSIKGKVVNPLGGEGPIVLVVIALDETGENAKAIVGERLIYGEGSFRFRQTGGNFFLLAFQDENEDGEFQPTERVGWNSDSKMIKVTAGVDIHDLLVEMRPIAQSREELPQLYVPRLEPLPSEIPQMVFGEVVTLDDPRFTAENGSLGMWKPSKFMKTIESGIYFIEPYNPDKIPVLFVHGVGGNPSEWKTLAQGLDLQRFQPWFYYYPSGLRLPLLGEVLSEELQYMQEEYEFTQMAVVAHSMGGLVSRSAINDLMFEERSEFVRCYLTLSTPWMGHDMASKGVEYSPVIIPCWYDMSPNSPFLQQLFTKPLPQDMPYHLLFSYGGEQSLFVNESSDGVIALRSQLRGEAQNAAITIRGFNAGHVEILHDPLVVQELNFILADRLGTSSPK